MPAIVVVTPIMDYTRCFLSHPYELNTRLFNDSDLPAKYDLVPQVMKIFHRKENGKEFPILVFLYSDF